MRVLGLIVRVPIYLGALLFVGLMMPSSSSRVAELTLGDLGHWAGGIICMVALVWYLLHPSPEPRTQRNWAALGLFIVLGIAGFAGYVAFDSYRQAALLIEPPFNISVQAPGGSTVLFPEGTSATTINNVMQQNFGPFAQRPTFGRYSWTAKGGLRPFDF